MTPRIGPAVARRFDLQAPAYCASMEPLLRPVGRRLLDEFARGPLAQLRRPTVVDVGTGVGTLMPRIHEAFPRARVLGVDRSPGMLALVPAGLNSATMDGARLALATDSVDLLLAVLVLFFLDDPLDGLREARRVLRTGGQVGTATWGSTLESPALRVWAECLAEFDSQPPPEEPWNFEAVDSRDKVAQLLDAAGFAQVRAFDEQLVTTLEPEQLLRLKTTVGRDKRLFDALDPERQAACVALARRRLAALDARDFVSRATVVYGLGDTT